MIKSNEFNKEVLINCNKHNTPNGFNEVTTHQWHIKATTLTKSLQKEQYDFLTVF